MNTVIDNLSTAEIVEIAHAMGTVHYSLTKEKFMSTTVTEVDTAKNAKTDRRKFATDLITEHRKKHNVHPTERLTPDHYDQLATVLAAQHGIEHPKAVSYLKNLDSSLRAPGKKSDVAMADIPGLAGQRVPGSEETVQEMITRMRTEEACSKEDIVKSLYDVFESQVSAGVLSVAIINAVVGFVFKQIKSVKPAKSNGGVPLNDLVLQKYAELCNKYGPEAVDSRNRLQGSAAEEFNTWYETTRGGRIGSVERTGERMAAHAQWHLNRLLKKQGVLGAYVRPPKAEKPAAATAEGSSDGTAAPRKRASRKAAETAE